MKNEKKNGMFKAEQYKSMFDGTKVQKKYYKEETKLQKAIVKYVILKHPGLEFRSDSSAAMKLTIGQAMENKRVQKDKNWPDMFFAKRNSKFAGLFLEIKVSRDKIYRQDGSFKRDEHTQGQLTKILKLMDEGYAAQFGCGFDECIEIIENYLKIK